MSGGPQCPHSLALQPRYLHGCSSAALCTSGLGVHGEWLAEQSMKPRMSPAEPAPSTQTPQLLCPPRQQVLGIALTENHGTDVDIPENIFRKEDRATFTLPVPLLPSGSSIPSPVLFCILWPLCAPGWGKCSQSLSTQAEGLLENPVHKNSSREQAGPLLDGRTFPLGFSVLACQLFSHITQRDSN